MPSLTNDYYEELKKTPGLLSEQEVLVALSEKARGGSINALTALLRWYREHAENEDDAPQDGFAAVDAAAAPQQPARRLKTAS